MTLRLTVSGSGQITDGIAAVVGDDTITFSELKNKVSETEIMLREQCKDVADKKPLVEKVMAARAAALDELIERKLLFRDFHSNGWLPESIVDMQVFSMIEQQFSGDKQAFTKMLQDNGMTEADYRNTIKENIIVSYKRQSFKLDHEKEFDDRLPLRDQSLYRQWIEKLRSQCFVQVLQ